MNQSSLRCTKCGAQKRIFWSKRLKVPMTSLFVLTPIFFVVFSLVSSPTLKAIFGIAGFASLVIIVALMKIRCLRCEPHWLPEAWGGANYDKK
jgi:hypothetical protein